MYIGTALNNYTEYFIIQRIIVVIVIQRINLNIFYHQILIESVVFFIVQQRRNMALKRIKLNGSYCTPYMVGVYLLFSQP